MSCGKLIIFSAPSGSGKSTIINRLINEYRIPVRFSVSATSRLPRGSEQNGVDYYFLSAQTFEERIHRGDFLEYEEVYPGVYYGTLRSEIEKSLEKGENILLDVDVIGALTIKEIYGDQACTLFIQPPSIEVLEKRLKNRNTDSSEKIEERLNKASYELGFAAKFDRCLINDDLDSACQIAYSIISDFLSEKERHVVLFPGSFNPMHIGHLCLANYIVESRPEVDELWMTLTPSSPFKESDTLLPIELRSSWAKHLLNDGHKDIKLSLIEEELSQPYYTVNTLEYLAKKFPSYRFSLLMGMDSWLSLPQWHRADDLINMGTIYVCPRPGYPTPTIEDECKQVIFMNEAPFFDISSTVIRTFLRRGAAFPYLLHTSIQDPIYDTLIQGVRALKE